MEYYKYKKEVIFELLIRFENIIVSLDKIGSEYHDDTVKRALVTELFLIENRVFDSLTNLRYILTENFTNNDESEIDEKINKIINWKLPSESDVDYLKNRINKAIDLL